jgi:hypothetical protein
LTASLSLWAQSAINQVFLAIRSNKVLPESSAAFARFPPARAFRPAIIIENVMQPGERRAILRDGADLPVDPSERLRHQHQGAPNL